MFKVFKAKLRTLARGQSSAVNISQLHLLNIDKNVYNKEYISF